MVGLPKRFPEFSDVFRWVHSKQLCKLFPEIFWTGKTNPGSRFVYIYVCINKEFSRFSEPDKADKGIYRLP